ncbi:hypothetical protein [Glaciecola sp. 1036]|uniref:hypothetical protein n=1 Tax=Alteromonadaceae TaxID=72275 RepID=UPI003D04BB64
MGDFFGVEKCMNEILSEVAPKKFFKPGPTVFIQLLDKIDGGVTNVEARAFRESVIAVGAVEVYVPKTDKPLTKSVLLEKDFESWDENA